MVVGEIPGAPSYDSDGEREGSGGEDGASSVSPASSSSESASSRSESSSRRIKRIVSRARDRLGGGSSSGSKEVVERKEKPGDPAPEGGDRRLEAAAEMQAADQQDEAEVRRDQGVTSGRERSQSAGSKPIPLPSKSEASAPASEPAEQPASSSEPAEQQDPPSVDELGGLYSDPSKRAAAERIAEQSDLDVGEIADVQRTDDNRLKPELTEAARKDRARTAIARSNPRIDEGDIESVEAVDDGDRFQATLTEEARVRQARGQFKEESDLEPGEDVVFRPVEDGYETELTEQGAKKQIARQNEDIDVGDIESVQRTDEDSYQAVLTEEAKREQAGLPAREDPAKDFDPPVSSIGGVIDGTGEFVGDVRQEGWETVERGGAASEASRDIAATGLAIGFGNPDELAGIDVEERVGRAPVTGPEVTAIGLDTPGALPAEFSESERGAIDPKTAETIDFQTGGFLSEERRSNLEAKLENRGETITGTPAGETKSGGVAGARRGAAELSKFPGGLLLAADTASRAGDDLPEAVDKRGAATVALSGSAIAGRSLRRGVTRAQNDPAGAAAFLAVSAGGATAVTRGAQAGVQRAADARVRRRADATVDLEDLTTERSLETGELPEFETSTDAPTAQAVGEVRRRARDQPDELQRAGEMSVSDAVGVEASRRVGARLPGGDGGLDINVRQRVSDVPNRVGRAVGRVEGRVGRLRDDAIAARRRVGAASNRFEDATVGRVEAAAFRAGERVGARSADLEAATLGRADDAAFRAGRQIGRRLTYLDDTAGDPIGRVDAAFNEALSPVTDRAFAAGRRVGAGSQRFEDATLARVEETAFLAGERVGALTVDLENATLGGGLRRVDDATLGRLEETAFRAGERVGARSADLEEATLGRVGDTAFRAGERVGARSVDVEDATLGRLEEPAFRAGERIGARSVDVEAATLGRVDDRAFRAGRQLGRRLADLDDTAFRAGERVGEPIGRVDDAFNEAISPVTDRAFATGQRVGGFVADVEERADADGALGESVLLRSDTERLPEDLDVQRGEFELPGLFVSPELSLLRLEETETSWSRPRLPRASDFAPDRERTSAFPGDRIEGAPQSAAGSGFAVRGPEGNILGRFGPGENKAARKRAEEVGGERIPDHETAGAEFFDEEAPEGTAFVRATGDRTRELEAVFAPDSEFRKQTELAVNLPDDGVATLDVFRRRDADDGDPGVAGASGDQDDAAGGDIVTVSELSRREVSRRSPEGEPVTPVPPTSVSSPVSDEAIDTGALDPAFSDSGLAESTSSSLASTSGFGDPVGSSSASGASSSSSSSGGSSGGFGTGSGGSGGSSSGGGGSSSFGGGSSTSYGGSGGSDPPGGPPTNPPTTPPGGPPGGPPTPPVTTTNPPSLVPPRCRDRHTTQEDDQRRDDIALGEDEWPNPVAAPDELDDVADDVLGRNDPEGRNPTSDLLDDLPGETDDNGRDPMGGFLP